MKTYQEFLALFPASPRKKAGKGWLVLCPCHNDHDPSLFVRPSKNPDFIADWDCQSTAGCTREAVLAAKGLKWADMTGSAYNQSTHSKGKLVATFVYRKVQGSEAYCIDRFNLTDGNKSFKARHQVNGEYVYNMAGVERILYNLHELSPAVAAGRRIYLPEGEAKVDLISSWGLVATTAPFGAMQPWAAGYSDSLRGAAEVVILPDNDQAGRECAEKRAKALLGIVGRVKVLALPNLPESGDIIDWQSAGEAKEQLEKLAEECPEWMPKQKGAKKAKGTGDEEVKETSFLALDHCLYEQIVSDGSSAFIEYDCQTGKTQIVNQVLQSDVKVIPLSGEEITLGAVKLPSGIGEYGNTLSLLQEIESHIYLYLDLSDNFRKFAAYYVLLSWLYDRFNTLPYLRFIGDTGCGKSRALDVCGGLCYKCTSASGCVTPAPIYRMLKRWGGTIILDEADLQNSDEYHEVTKILNCGFERNRPVIRAVKDNPDKLQILPTFGPKVFATRRRFKDAALEARCLTEIMQETARDDIPSTLTRAFYNE